ncbi:hypothetical protein [Kineococcus radiotolerans]|uniref:Uncharacterized protein n=1 Tax=Kineococcus radiotolerans (strain ATCC BAA-149 / DSM 14245 / SRS30216) TaxID=266940 RepID=A6W9M4_KINRD|nr:hypothetical protein [Kineococcus radiotolerans]ABS03513.1 hypothetical protein Krad_2028 [Kineococcus radiotolerans SRS30216 = ATCC BAA-149]
MAGGPLDQDGVAVAATSWSRWRWPWRGRCAPRWGSAAVSALSWSVGLHRADAGEPPPVFSAAFPVFSSAAVAVGAGERARPLGQLGTWAGHRANPSAGRRGIRWPS